MTTESATINLTCLRISNGASSLKAKPTRLKLLNWGDNKTKKGVVRVGEKTLSMLPEMQARFGFDQIALDYEHNTVPGTPEYERTKEPREVAAYGIPEVVRGEGLFLNLSVYTPSGERNALEYMDISPAVKEDENGEVIFIHSTALCRQGATEDLSYYSITITPEKKETHMEMKDVLSQLTTLSATVETQKTEIGKLIALNATVSAQNDALKAIVSRQDKIERDALVTKAIMAGKVIPLKAEEIDATDLKTLTALIDNLKPTVPMDRRTTTLNVEQPTDGIEVAAKERAAKVDSRAAELLASKATTSLIQAYSMAESEIPVVAPVK